MPGAKRASGMDDVERPSKRIRGSDAPSTVKRTVDELGFELDAPTSRALIASGAKCEAAWDAFVAARQSRSDATHGTSHDIESRPEEVREFVRGK